MSRLQTKLPRLIGYADRPLLRGIATSRAAGLTLDEGGGAPNGALAFAGSALAFAGKYIVFTKAAS
ncbi:hypothetical protein SAMN05880590_102725 [Rhizobium sp. RU35A]|uniref:hypothetical protein n=1 Tax=Rhizobium sp. RU35A TaxID=1907414 RepID=UPI0009555167|nr:hypothetical protein [Rhizobium sp. RU35A]SIQ23605.1 hypothetical protein SAMN05880590_102725 [Rhizobium sp. RU35A]